MSSNFHLSQFLIILLRLRTPKEDPGYPAITHIQNYLPQFKIICWALGKYWWHENIHDPWEIFSNMKIDITMRFQTSSPAEDDQNGFLKEIEWSSRIGFQNAHQMAHGCLQPLFQIWCLYLASMGSYMCLVLTQSLRYLSIYFFIYTYTRTHKRGDRAGKIE